MQDLLTTELWNGTTLQELLTLEFLASLAGSVLGAVAIILGGFILAGWAHNRIVGLTRRYARLDATLVVTHL